MYLTSGCCLVQNRWVLLGSGPEQALQTKASAVGLALWALTFFSAACVYAFSEGKNPAESVQMLYATNP